MVPHSVLDVCERDGSCEVVLLDTRVAPLCCCGVASFSSSSRNVHADHVPEVTLQRPAMVGRRPRGRRVGHWLCFDHGHGDGARLLGAAAAPGHP